MKQLTSQQAKEIKTAIQAIRSNDYRIAVAILENLTKEGKEFTTRYKLKKCLFTIDEQNGITAEEAAAEGRVVPDVKW